MTHHVVHLLEDRAAVDAIPVDLLDLEVGLREDLPGCGVLGGDDDVGALQRQDRSEAAEGDEQKDAHRERQEPKRSARGGCGDWVMGSGRSGPAVVRCSSDLAGGVLLLSRGRRSAPRGAMAARLHGNQQRARPCCGDGARRLLARCTDKAG